MRLIPVRASQGAAEALHPSRGLEGTRSRHASDPVGRCGRRDRRPLDFLRTSRHHESRTRPSNFRASPRRRRRGPDRRDRTPDRGVLRRPIRPDNKGKHRRVHIRPLAHSDGAETSSPIRTRSGFSARSDNRRADRASDSDPCFIGRRAGSRIAAFAYFFRPIVGSGADANGGRSGCSIWSRARSGDHPRDEVHRSLSDGIDDRAAAARRRELRVRPLIRRARRPRPPPQTGIVRQEPARCARPRPSRRDPSRSSGATPPAPRHRVR